MRPKWWYRFVLLCGAAPLAIGIATFLLWLDTADRFLETVGLLTLLGGTVAVLVGLGVLYRVNRHDLRTGEVAPERIRRRTFAAAGLLLVNFPAAAAIIVAVISLLPSWKVTVRNDSASPLVSCRLIGPNAAHEIGPIAAGDSSSFRLWPRGEGEIRCEFQRGDVHGKIVVVGYVTSGQGGATEVRIRPDGTAEVVRSWNDRKPSW